MKRSLLIMVIILISLVNAETVKINNQVSLIQTCNNCTYCNISGIMNPSKEVILTNLVMTKDGTIYNYTLNSSYTDEIGYYYWYYDCGNTVESATGRLEFLVTSTGEQVSLTNLIIVVVYLVLGIICLILGFSFDSSKWIMKSFMFLMTLIFGLLALNSAAIITSESTGLSTMNQMGYIVLIPLLLVFFLYVFINWTTEQFRILKNKRELRWK